MLPILLLFTIYMSFVIPYIDCDHITYVKTYQDNSLFAARRTIRGTSKENSNQKLTL